MLTRRDKIRAFIRGAGSALSLFPRKHERLPTLDELNARFTANHAEIMRKAQENTRRLTGRDRF